MVGTKAHHRALGTCSLSSPHFLSVFSRMALSLLPRKKCISPGPLCRLSQGFGVALTAFQGQNPRVGWQVGLWRDKTTPMCDPGACNARTFSPWANAPGPWCNVFTGQDKQLNHCCSGSQCAYSRYRNQCLYLIKACDRLIQGSAPCCITQYSLLSRVPWEAWLGEHSRQGTPSST